MVTLKVSDLISALKNENIYDTASVYEGKTDSEYNVRNAVIIPHNNTSDLVLFVNKTNQKKALSALVVSDVLRVLNNAQHEGVETVCISFGDDIGYRVRAVAQEKHRMIFFIESSQKVDLKGV